MSVILQSPENEKEPHDRGFDGFMVFLAIVMIGCLVGVAALFNGPIPVKL